MHHLGLTRSACHLDHFLLTPDTFVRTPMPGLERGMAIVHASPARSAAFTQYTVEFEPGGHLAPSAHQRFIFVLEGELVLSSADRALALNDYAYLPPQSHIMMSASIPARAAIIEKPYSALPGVTPPPMLTGRECAIAPQPLLDDTAIEVRSLLPDDPAFDFAVNTMTYLPGASLPMVEIHVMEHGLLMLAGGGIYRLGESWYPVTAGDFIWMRAFCPQWFAAVGKTPAKYLIYKDFNRHPLRS